MDEPSSSGIETGVVAIVGTTIARSVTSKMIKRAMRAILCRLGELLIKEVDLLSRCLFFEGDGGGGGLVSGVGCCCLIIYNLGQQRKKIFPVVNAKFEKGQFPTLFRRVQKGSTWWESLVRVWASGDADISVLCQILRF